MRILFVTPYFLPYRGGVEQAIYHLASNILEQDATKEIFILTTFSAYPEGISQDLPKNEVIEGIKIYRLNFFLKNIPGFYHAYNAGLISFQLEKILREISPDVIHYFKTEWFIPNLITFLLTQNKSKHVFTSSFHNKTISIKHVPMVWANRFLLRQMDSVIVPSDETAKTISKTFQIAYTQVSIIPWGAKTNSSIKKITKINPKIKILCVGRLNQTKGQLEFLQQILQRQPKLLPQIEMTFVGKDAGGLPKIKELIKINNLENIFFFEDLTDEQLGSLMESSDFLISPSRYEAFGLAIVEALGYGIPVVAFKTGALSETIKNGAFLIKYPNWEEFCRAVHLLATDITLRQTMGDDGKKFVQMNYSWNKTAQEYIKIYNHICNQKMK